MVELHGYSQWITIKKGEKTHRKKNGKRKKKKKKGNKSPPPPPPPQKKKPVKQNTNLLLANHGKLVFLNNLLDCIYSENGSEFHRDALENVRLVLKRSMRGVGIFILI